MKTTRAIAAAALGATLALSACSGPTAQGVLADTAANLSEIRSGDLSMALRTEGQGGLDGQMGWRLEGPFSMPEEGGLPVTELAYTQVAGDQEETVTFISTGQAAFIELDGQAYELPVDDTEALELAPAVTAQAGSLGQLRLDRWIEDASLAEGGDVDGVDTWKVTAELDAAVALQDLVALSESLGSQEALASFEGASREQLERAVESATLEVWTGKDDRMLRRMVMDLRLGLADLRDLEESLQDLGDLRLLFEVELSDLGREVTVEQPADALPHTELPIGA